MGIQISTTHELWIHLVLILLLVILSLSTLWRIKSLEKKIWYFEALADHDALTGVLNRRGGDDAMRHQEKLVTRDRSGKTEFAIIAFDLDDFKPINDKFGHHVGDLVLKFFVEVLSETLREDYDIIVRPGGDEFYAILPECNLEQAKKVREEIKHKLSSSSLKSNGIKLHISASMGIATSHKKSGRIRSIKEMHELADWILYWEKKHKD